MNKILQIKVMYQFFFLFFLDCSKGSEYFCVHCVGRVGDSGRVTELLLHLWLWTAVCKLTNVPLQGWRGWGWDWVRMQMEKLHGQQPNGTGTGCREGKIIIILSWQGRWVIQVIWVLPPKDYEGMGTACSPEERSALYIITVGPLIKSEEDEDFFLNMGGLVYLGLKIIEWWSS